LAKGVGACRFISKPRQQPLTEASTGVDHMSTSADDTHEFGANVSCNLQSKTWVASELTGSAFALIVAHVVYLNGFSCFHFWIAYMRQLSHWRSCTAGGPRTLCWATCLKRLRTTELMGGGSLQTSTPFVW